jgi:hypothetical protein
MSFFCRRPVFLNAITASATRGNNLFSVPDDKGIEKISQGLGIKGAGAAGNDQGKGIIPLIRVKGDTGQIKQGHEYW